MPHNSFFPHVQNYSKFERNPPFTGCDDKDLYKCYELEATGKLDCHDNYLMYLCCGTCIALSEYANDRPYTRTTRPSTLLPTRYPTPPPGWTTSPQYYRCSDRDAKKCEEMQKYNRLNCVVSMEDVSFCCATCNRILDYLQHIRYFTK